jgi:membrane-associated protease RseP (regulator of RpoE activity)
VLAIDGRTIDSPGDVARAVGLAAPGRKTKLTLWRDKARTTVEVVLGEAPGERPASRLGFEVRPLTPGLAREMDRRSSDGVVVTRVEEGTPAAEAGIQRGDVIVEVNRRPVKTLADFERATRDLKKGERLAVRLERGEVALYVAVVPDKAGVSAGDRALSFAPGPGAWTGWHRACSDLKAMRDLLMDVRDGMAVYDRDDDRIGTVREVYLGSEPGPTTNPVPRPPHSLIDDLVQALAPPAIPEVLWERLLGEGFVRIDTSGPFAADRFAFASQIREVSEAGVRLDAGRDDLLRR